MVKKVVCQPLRGQYLGILTIRMNAVTSIPATKPLDESQTYNKGFILQFSLIAALGGLLFGYDTAIISGTIPFITPYFQLTEYSLGWAVGSVLIGCAIGAVIAGSAADRFGRKAVLLLCAVLFAVSGVAAGLATSLPVFILARIVGGIGVGAAAMVAPVYIAEMAPARYRGKLVSIYQLAIVSGILAAYFTNYFLANAGANNWRWMLASQTGPAILFGFMLLLVPDTPRWLVSKGRNKEAETVLTKIGGPSFSESELKSIQQSFAVDRVGLAELFSKYKTVMWLGIGLAVFQQITGINAILYYAPVIFKQTGVGTADSFLQTVLIGVINVLTTFIAIFFVDKVGRRKFLLAGCLLMGLSLTAVALCFYFQYFDNYLVLIFTLLYVAVFGCTLGAVTWVYLSEIFPNRARGLAMATATLALWLADFVVTYTFPLLNKSFSTAATLGVYAAACVAALIFVYTRLPETAGKSLEEIEKSFKTNSHE